MIDLFELQLVPFSLVAFTLFSLGDATPSRLLYSFFKLISIGLLLFSSLELDYSSFSLSSSSITLLLVIGTDNTRVLPLESPESNEILFVSVADSYLTK